MLRVARRFRAADSHSVWINFWGAGQHKLIDELPAEELDLAERVLARLEMDRLWQQVREGFTQDWADGKYARLDEVIREVRADLKQRAT